MPTRTFSDIQERRIARYLDGVVQVNSGGTKTGGGDVHTKTFLIEAKTSTTPKTSMSVKKQWLTKAHEQAFQQGKSNSAVAISFGDGEDYFIIGKHLMKMLIMNLEEN